MSIFEKREPTRETRFSDFIRTANSSDKKKIYSIVLKKAVEEQSVTIAKAKEKQSLQMPV